MRWTILDYGSPGSYSELTAVLWDILNFWRKHSYTEHLLDTTQITRWDSSVLTVNHAH